jgi:hypothetical protein
VFVTDHGPVCSNGIFNVFYLFFSAGLPLLYKRLKKAAVPSIFPWNTNPLRTRAAEERAQRLKDRLEKKSSSAWTH